MIKYFSYKILLIIPVLFGITFFAFSLGRVAGGDPVYLSLSRSGIIEPTEEQVDARRAELNLDKPYIEQYLLWVKNVIGGDFGESIYNARDIQEELTKRLPNTILLSFFSLLITGTLGIILGSLMAIYKHRLFDHILSTLISLVRAFPTFVIGILLIFIFAERLKILPTSGITNWRSFILPSLCLSIPSSATLARLMRANLIDELNKQYILFAKSKGIRFSRVLYSHALKNSLGPYFTYLGMNFAAILGGTAIIESLFAVPGIGSYVLQGIYNRDYPIIQAYVVLTSFIYLLVTVLLDGIYLLINPRFRQGVLHED